MNIIKGQCFTYKTEKGIKGYFYTGIREGEYMVMCEMVPPHKMTKNSFWKITDEFFNNGVESGMIELI